MATAEAEKADWVYKLIIIGDSSVGKSSMMQRFITGKLSSIAKETVGVEFGSKMTSIPNPAAANEDGAPSELAYYRGAVGCMVVFSIADRSSFDHLPQWLEDAKTHASEHVQFILIGNKTDLEESRQVTLLEASKFAQERGMPYLELSAMTGRGVDAAFHRLSKDIAVKTEEGSIPASAVRPKGQASSGKGAAAGGAGAAGGSSSSGSDSGTVTIGADTAAGAGSGQSSLCSSC